MDVALLSVILAVAAGLRFLETDRPFIGRHDYHGAFYSLAGAGRRLTEYYNWPPLTDVLYSLSFFLFGESELASRILPIGFSLGTIVLVYLIGKELFNRETGLLAAALLAIFPGAIYFARIEHYSFFVALTVWAYNRWLPGDSGQAGSVGRSASFDISALLSRAGLRTNGVSSRRSGYLWLAAGSNLIGLGFSFAAPVIAVPATFVLAVAHRDLRGQAVLVGSTVAALVAWFAFVELRVGLDSLQTRGDSVTLWFDAVERSLWKEAALTFFFNMFTPIALAGAFIWLVSLFDRRSVGDLVLLAWVAGMMAWLVSAPYHSRIHDFWWLPLATPLALIVARAALNILSSSLARGAAAVALVGLTAWMSVGETREYLDRREHGVPPVEFGQAVRPYLADGDTMIGWYPNEIFYAGVPGYISGMIPDEPAYLEILAEKRPALIVLAADDPAWFYQRAWDAGYVPFTLLGWNVYFRADTAARAAAGDAARLVSLAATGAIDAGSVLRGPGEAASYYYYDWGLKMPISAGTAATLGLDAPEVPLVDASVFDTLPVGPTIAELREGSVFAGLDGRRFVMQDGEKHAVSGDAELAGLGLSDAPVVFVPDGLIALIPDVEALGGPQP